MVSNHGIANIHSIRSPDSTHASVNLGISSVRRRFVHDMLPNFTRHLSPMPRLHFVTLGIGCPSPSVVSRIRLRLRGTLPHPRILLSFFPCIIDASRPPNKETPYLFLSRDHKAAAGCESLRLEAVTRPQGVWVQLAAGESDWSLSAWSVFFPHVSEIARLSFVLMS